MLYKAISIGKYKRILVPEQEVVDKLMDLYSKDPKKDYYVSIYTYNDDHYKQFKQTGSLSGIKDVKTSSMVFDFDDKDINTAKSDALTLIGRLTQKGIDINDINISYSGSKGFHVEVQTDSTFTREEMTNITSALSDDLKTNDVQIRDEQRVLRAPLTINEKSGAYKIPLTYDELSSLSVDEIVGIAKSELSDFRYELASNNFNRRVKLPIDIDNLKTSKKQTKQTVEVINSEDKPDFSKNNTGLTNAKYALLEGFFEQGERHEAVIILAATFKALGWHKELTYNNLKATLRLRSKRMGLPDLDQAGKEELYKEVESVYSPLWKGGTFSEDVNELLLKTKARYGIEEKFKQNTVITIGELKHATENFLKNLKDNRIYTGVESLDKNLILTKGMMFGALGCPGSGKTSFLNVFAENTSKKHGHVLYFSMDMSKDLLGTKIIQRYTGYSLEKLEDMILHGTYDDNYLEAVEKFSEDYRRVGFCFETGYDPAKIALEIEKYQQKIGERISLVAVDYLEKVVGPYSDDTANSGFVAGNLANIANKYDTCVGVLLQPSKITGSPADPIPSYRSIKGASRIEQDARAIVGLWRPGYNPEDMKRDRYMSIAILKQNMGKLGKFDYMWDGSRGQITEMTSEERRLFKMFLDEMAAEKDKDDEL